MRAVLSETNVNSIQEKYYCELDGIALATGQECRPFLSPQSALVFLPAFQGMYDEADLLFLRAIEILEKTVGLDHPDLASTLSYRAALLRAQVRLNPSIQGKVVAPHGDDSVLDNRWH